MSLRLILRTVAGLTCCVGLLLGQAKQPKPKSQKEAEAINAIFQAQTAETRIAAANDLLTKFADTEFKNIALQVIAMTYQQKGDAENMIIYAERVLEGDPKNYSAMIMIASALAQRTREFDLDKEEKLSRAEKMAKLAIETLKTAEKPRADLTEEQWTGLKKDSEAESYQALGMIASARKKHDDAIAAYKMSIEGAATPDPATMVRLGSAYNSAGKYDDAIAILDKVLAQADVHAQIKQFAQAEKDKAVKAKTPAG